MKDNAYLICTFFLIVIDLAISFGWAIDSSVKHNKQIQLENEIKAIKKEIKEDKDRYQREIDTCLDILVNKRWEQ